MRYFAKYDFDDDPENVEEIDRGTFVYLVTIEGENSPPPIRTRRSLEKLRLALDAAASDTGYQTGMYTLFYCPDFINRYNFSQYIG